MIHEWKIGELAVCVIQAGLPYENPIPVGKILCVREVQEPTEYTGYALAFYGWENPIPARDGRPGYLACKFRPLDDSDKQRLTEKYKDSLPKRSLVKDDDAARKRIEELNREVRG